MALAGTTIWEVITAGSDTTNSGAFDPGQTAGMWTVWGITNANTASPIVTNANYVFVASDVSHWFYLASGTSSIPAWYKIASISSGSAVLNATAGSGVLANSIIVTTTTGCGTAATLTSQTGAIDYSQASTPRYTYTDMASAAGGLTVSSAAKPFNKEQVGNSLVITGGTNFNTGRYVIASIGASSVATVVGPTNITSAAGSNGTGSQGGSLASMGQAGAAMVANNKLFIQSGSYTVTSATANTSGGCLSMVAASGGNEGWVIGYSSVRSDYGTRPTITASGISNFSIIAFTGAKNRAANLVLDGASLANSRGIINTTNAFGTAYKIKAQNFTATGVGTLVANLCEATTCSSTITAGAISSPIAYACWSHDNTVPGFIPAGTFSTYNIFAYCIASKNAGATSDGFNLSSAAAPNHFIHCTAYNNGRHGFTANNSSTGQWALINCVAVLNSTGTGFNVDTPGTVYQNCAYFNNSTNVVANALNLNGILLTADPFISGATGNFALTTTSGGGLSLRRAGVLGIFPGGLSTGYQDVGTIQHLDANATIGGIMGVI